MFIIHIMVISVFVCMCVMPRAMHLVTEVQSVYKNIYRSRFANCTGPCECNRTDHIELHGQTQATAGRFLYDPHGAFMNLCDKHNLLKTLNHFFLHNQKLIKPKNMVRIFIHFVVFLNLVQAVSDTALSNILVDYIFLTSFY